MNKYSTSDENNNFNKYGGKSFLIITFVKLWLLFINSCIYIYIYIRELYIYIHFITDKSISLSGIFIKRVYYANKKLYACRSILQSFTNEQQRCTHRRPVLNSFICSVVRAWNATSGLVFIRNRKVSFVLVVPRRWKLSAMLIGSG